MSKKTIEYPKYFVAENTWKIVLNYEDDKTEVLSGMPDYISAQRNYEALVRFITKQKQRG